MDALLGLLGFLGMISGAIALLVLLIARRRLKPALIVLGISFVLFVAGLSMPSDTTTPPSQSEKTPAEITLEQSRQNFSKGVEHFNNEEYEEAISMFEQVIEEDSENYQKAQGYLREARKHLTLENMQAWEGTGKARVAVSNVIAMSSFSDGFTTWEPEDPKSTCFLLVGVGVYNGSNSTLHANPNYVTLICNNQVFNPDLKTYSLDNYLDAVDLQPGTYTTGWLVFIVPKAETYTLIYEGLFDSAVKKEIVVTQTK